MNLEWSSLGEAKNLSGLVSPEHPHFEEGVQRQRVGHEHFAGFRADEGTDDARLFELIDDGVALLF